MSEETKPATQDTTTVATSAVTEAKTETAQVDKSLVTEEVKAEGSEEVKTETAKPSEEKPAVPEKYELKLPEGSSLDKSALEGVEQFAKEHKLTQEQAQAVLEKQNEAVAGFWSKQQAQVKELNDVTWFNELKDDKEIGGEKFKEHGHLAYKAGVKVFGEGFMDKIIAAKLNHYPEFFKGLVKLGKESQEGEFVNGGNSPPSKKPLEERLYGSKQ